MKLIKVLTDKEVLGTEGMSKAAPRYTARAIVRKEDRKYAVMYSEKYNLYSLPGGGIEEGEDPLTALRREILEETGCSCTSVEELGIIEENRASLNYTQINFYYIAEAMEVGKMQLTQAEQDCRTNVQWHTFNEMKRLIMNQSFDRVQGKYLVARDCAAVLEFEHLCT